MSNNVEKLLDALIEEIASKAEAKISTQYIDDNEKIEYSQNHIDKMNALFKAERRKEKVRKISYITTKVACIVLILTTVTMGTIFSVSAWRSKFLNFFTGKENPNSDYSFSDMPDVMYDRYGIKLGYIPKGFELEEKRLEKSSLFLLFENDNQYFQITVNNIDGNFSVDTEEADLKKISINGYEAAYISASDVNSLIWHNGLCAFTISGNISKKEIMHIAESFSKK